MPDERVFLHVVSVSLPGGWGYEIYAGGKKYIRQQSIPGVTGRQLFHSEEEALKTGRLVIQKISHNQLPTIYRADLDSLGVRYK